MYILFLAGGVGSTMRSRKIDNAIVFVGVVSQRDVVCCAGESKMS